ncbi:hypothetical protein ACLH2F_34640, partial [Klebsiella grimontii]
ATDVGFTTTGVDAISFANDVVHFVLMDGDTLRSNLGSGDGQKLIGEYSSISELRASTLDHHGQKVKVKFWDIELGTALVNVFYAYDANDHISVDDGYRTIVNAAGQRFKALLNDTLDLRIV